MARHKRNLDSSEANQMNLFDMIEEINPQELTKPDFEKETRPLALRIKDAIAESIKGSGMKRYVVAGKMSELLGAEVTESMLNAYTAESKEGYRMPAEYIPVFCKIVKYYTVLEILVSASGCRMIKSEDAYYLEIGRLQAVEKAAHRKHVALTRELKRIRGET